MPAKHNNMWKVNMSQACQLDPFIYLPSSLQKSMEYSLCLYVCLLGFGGGGLVVWCLFWGGFFCGVCLFGCLGGLGFFALLQTGETTALSLRPLVKAKLTIAKRKTTKPTNSWQHICKQNCAPRADSCCWADSSDQQHFHVDTSALLEPSEEEAA